jgi:predicted nucleic acid-binding protein
VTGSAKLTGLTLDTGALIAVERGDQRVREMLRFALHASLVIDAPAGAVAQAWRGGPRQTRLAQLLAQPEVEIPALDGTTARAVGRLCGLSGHHDIVDVHVALHATVMGHHVVTSDPDDIRAVNPSLPLIPI